MEYIYSKYEKLPSQLGDSNKTSMMRSILAVLVVCSLAAIGQAKVFSRCALAKELLHHGIPKGEIPTWVCLVESESSRNTKATHRNTNGSVDYGLFQINNAYWCAEGNKPGKDCHVTCKALLSDNISASVKCAKLIKQRQGWRAWYGWRNKCQGKKLPDVSHCY